MESGLCRSRLLCHYPRSSDGGPEQLSCLYQHLRVLDSHEINISCSLEFQHGEEVARLNSGKYHRYTQRNCSCYATIVSVASPIYAFIHAFILQQISRAHIYSFFLGPGNTALNKKEVPVLRRLTF